MTVDKEQIQQFATRTSVLARNHTYWNDPPISHFQDKI